MTAMAPLRAAAWPWPQEASPIQLAVGDSGAPNDESIARARSYSWGMLVSPRSASNNGRWLAATESRRHREEQEKGKEMTTTARTRVGILLILAALTIQTRPPSSEEKDSRDPDFIAQIATVASIRVVVQHIAFYREDHAGKLPTSIFALRDLFGIPNEHFADGWKRPLFYYTTGSSYMLASFGKTGHPDGQESEPGGTAEDSRFESDIVLIDGMWAQSPRNVDREIE